MINNIELYTLNPDSIIELFTLDLNPIGVNELYRFCNSSQTNGAFVSFASQTYMAYPIQATGFAFTGRGEIPRPVLTVSNILELVTSLTNEYQDLIGAKLTRSRTFAKHLDGFSEPNPTAKWADDIFYIERKSSEDELIVQFELSSNLTLSNAKIPGRTIFEDICTWQYRGPYCNYDGPPVADQYDNPTTDPLLDQCSFSLKGCKLRFFRDGIARDLPFGGFPGVDAITR